MVKKTFQRLKSKWGIKSNWDAFLICMAFSLAGMSVGFVRRPVFAALGITRSTPLWIKVMVYIPLIVPVYQISLIIFGTLLGQFPFFWNKQKQLAFRVRQLVARSS